MLYYDFDWSVLWRHPYGGMFLKGIWTTVHLSLSAWMIALLLGLLVGLFRTLPIRGARLVGGAYVEVFRNIPLLVQLFFWYFAAPSLFPRDLELWLYGNVNDLGYWMAIIALGTYTAARVAEAVRSGLLAVPLGQYRAAYSTGLSGRQTYRHVVLPYALRVAWPLLTTEFLTCFKNSALAMTVGVLETTGTAGYIDSFTFHGLETTTAASLVYLATSGAVILTMNRIEKRLHIPGLIRRGA
ncbi:MAG: amino acid ABC transporter permease [Deltaproteobacteria bacterium]|nr:amino acid ABC transporter permease [Deltaproteobacteria bacterium]